jgi:hypothetical protein
MRVNSVRGAPNSKFSVGLLRLANACGMQGFAVLLNLHMLCQVMLFIWFIF